MAASGPELREGPAPREPRSGTDCAVAAVAVLRAEERLTAAPAVRGFTNREMARQGCGTVKTVEQRLM
ncbi:hypothetical protein AB0945_30185 [Streptomyces sp. NPDC005474]|uniref:hypothetical protein n=1 Tax=Streptomyces sp. NPDC005474 TaxID=3154878 RepID=UPI003456ED08